MNSFSIRLCRFFLPRLLAKACPSSIPRSGKEGAAIDCYYVHIDQSGEPYLVALAIKGDLITCLSWNGRMFADHTEVSLLNVVLKDIRITHYVGLLSIEYVGIVDFAIGWVTRWPYLRLIAYRAYQAVDQYLFNKKKLVTTQRKNLLRFLVTSQDRGHDSFSSISVMSDFYSVKAFGRPDYESILSKITTYLDSFVETGELTKVGMDYRLTGHALKTVEADEREAEKHSQNFKVQLAIALLTAVLAVLAAAQANLIKLPTIIDWSGEKPVKAKAQTAPVVCQELKSPVAGQAPKFVETTAKQSIKK